MACCGWNGGRGPRTPAPGARKGIDHACTLPCHLPGVVTRGPRRRCSIGVVRGVGGSCAAAAVVVVAAAVVVATSIVAVAVPGGVPSALVAGAVVVGARSRRAGGVVLGAGSGG